MKKIVVILLLSSTGVHAQKGFDSLFVLSDTITVFSLENLYATMLENHPIVKQTNLLPEIDRKSVV